MPPGHRKMAFLFESYILARKEHIMPTTEIKRTVDFIWGDQRPSHCGKIGFAIECQGGVLYAFIFFNGEERHISSHYDGSSWQKETISRVLAGYESLQTDFSKERRKLLEDQLERAKEHALI